MVLIAFISCNGNVNRDNLALSKIAIREVGNRLLLLQQDSTSIIKPVIAIEEQTYQLSFQNPLSIQPTKLVTVIDSSFKAANLKRNYRVEVKQCLNNEVAYSYEMNIEKERTIIPCAGRYLPEACYIIEIKFLDNKNNYIYRQVILCALIFSFILFLIYYFKKKSINVALPKTTNYSRIGSFQFYPDQNKLVKAATEISLSKKECELLELFVAQPNQIIKRDELTKKVWEDNGVFVGRSLDTYISKLRKKLKDDTSIKLTNVHGVGYKLEISK